MWLVCVYLFMKLRKEILIRFSICLFIPLFFSHCATHEVGRELDKGVALRGETYARELAAQSPFEKVEMSWREASELMKERNPEYRKAIMDKEESKIKKGMVGNLTHEVRKSLTSSVQTTLNPVEIAKAMKNPVDALPKQLESITDLKNISHSLTQSEWGRVSQSVRADAVKRREVVNLHVLFCQGENLEKAEGELEELLDGEKVEQSKEFSKELAKTKGVMGKWREEWLDDVRDFFNAEYHDVEFNAYSRLNFYRDVDNPGFTDWRRWRLLENSDKLVVELRKQHLEGKPILPGMNQLTDHFGVRRLRSELSDEGNLNEGMVREVRGMLRDWRKLKSLQQKITSLEVDSPDSLEGSKDKSVSVSDLRRVTALYELKKKEVDYLKVFWVMDEECWNS